MFYNSMFQNLSSLPVAYTYNGKHYRGFSEDITNAVTKKDGSVTRTTALFCQTLTVTVEITDYEGYDAARLSVKFENKTDAPAARLADIDSLSMTYAGRDLTLCGIFGDGGDPVAFEQTGKNDGGYAPYAYPMYGDDAKPIHMEPPTGRGTYHYFPYFHLKTATGGMFAALGHPIIWRGSFIPTTVEADDGTVLPAADITLGQAHFDTALRPGESVTLPSVTLLYHNEADTDAAMNHWRHFFLDCITRKIGGKLFPPHMSGGTSWLYNEMRDATEDNQISAMNAYLDHNIPIDFWWMDAGWYFRREGEQLNIWMETGTWLMDTNRFPTSMAAISEHGQKHGVSTLLWFEPEMARLGDEDLSDKAVPKEARILGSPLMDMGYPGFADWCFERFSSILDAGKISLYRQDYGVNPADIFLHPDINPEGRVGYIENRYAQGYYALWDKLIEHYPDMMIDDCAAGGGRNDIDSMRRAVPLHKTDHDYSRQDDKQSMHQSLFAWIPYFGACLVGPDKCREVTPYMVQSSFCSWMALAVDITADTVDWDCLRRYTALWDEIKVYFTADYYPLTPWSHDDCSWRGWEFYDPTTGGGFAQLFRPVNAPDASYTVPFKGLDPAATYELWNRETDKKTIVSGNTLLSDGFVMTLNQPESAVVIGIKRIQ